MRSIKNILTTTLTHDSKETIGICLGGGGALGFAHIGVLQALEDNLIFPDVISGSSMGAIIGSLYAAGYTPAQMLQLIKDDKLYKITKLMSFQPAFWKSGFSDHTAIISLMNELIPNNSFEKLEKPMHVCVSNLSTNGWEIVDTSNKLDIWVSASASIPGVFNAMKINDMLYVDGGLLNNMPAQPLKNKCTVIIGSDVILPSSVHKNLKPRDILVASIRTVQHQNSFPGRESCDYLIEPNAIEKYHEFSYEFFQPIYQYGYRTATQFIVNHPDILKLQKKTQA